MKIVLDKIRVATPLMSKELDVFILKQIGRKIEKHILKEYSLLCDVKIIN